VNVRVIDLPDPALLPQSLDIAAAAKGKRAARIVSERKKNRKKDKQSRLEKAQGKIRRGTSSVPNRRNVLQHNNAQRLNENDDIR